MTHQRLQTGVTRLDELLGGGLLPGTLTVVLGATGIGKTQLGLQFAQQGLAQEGERGILFDMSSRGDSQNHAAYAQRLFDWTLQEADPADRAAESIWSRDSGRSDSLHLFRQAGRRVTLSDLDFDQQREWKADMNRKLERTIRFFYGNFIHGVRRCIIDGIEPTDRASDSFQFELFEYISHQILRKDCEWVARDLFRERFRDNAADVQSHPYHIEDIGGLLLCTSKEVLLDDLLTRPLESGDVLSNANTIILMGKVRNGSRMERALHVAKHRGSACDDGIHTFQVEQQGIVLTDG
ncbi:MAG: recombinase RecA [Planctomycetaceae bacterium]|nr:recombinase RecA [Planctomycetaceae bacterium]